MDDIPTGYARGAVLSRMRLFVPACGDRIMLSAPWSFTLVLERRNVDFAKSRKLVDPGASPHWRAFRSEGGYRSVDASLDAGTILECDRVYVRSYNKSRVQTSEDFDSITWKVINAKGKAVPRSRFWVKLVDANSIEFDGVETYRDRVKLARLVMES